MTTVIPRHPLRTALVIAFLGVFALLLVACKKPQPGAACKKEGEAVCINDKSAVVCTDGKWENEECRSITGCMQSGCSNSDHAVGEPCTEEGHSACAGKGKQMVKCAKKHWVLVNACNGQHGCVSNAFETNCDRGTLEAGESCEGEDTYSCTPDKKDLLVCKGKKMILSGHCRGMHACRQLGDKIECNQEIAELGDPCESEGKPACSVDKKSRLTCQKGKMAKDPSCKKGCRVMIQDVLCE
jgi:hypothetical protein